MKSWLSCIGTVVSLSSRDDVDSVAAGDSSSDAELRSDVVMNDRRLFLRIGQRLQLRLDLRSMLPNWELGIDDCNTSIVNLQYSGTYIHPGVINLNGRGLE